MTRAIFSNSEVIPHKAVLYIVVYLLKRTTSNSCVYYWISLRYRGISQCMLLFITDFIRCGVPDELLLTATLAIQINIHGQHCRETIISYWVCIKWNSGLLWKQSRNSLPPFSSTHSKQFRSLTRIKPSVKSSPLINSTGNTVYQLIYQ